MSTIAIQGTVTDLPDGEVSRQIDQRFACSPPPEKRSIVLTSDAPFVVNLDGMTGINALYIDANNHITAKIDSAAASAQLVPGENMFIVSRAVPITALSLIRVAGQATTVCVIIGQAA